MEEETDCNKQYIGPPIKLAYIQFNEQKEDITDIIQKLYSENFNWNGELYTAKSLQIPNIIGKDLYIEFDNPNTFFPNNIDYMKCTINSEELVINQPLFMPLYKPMKI